MRWWWAVLRWNELHIAPVAPHYSLRVGRSNVYLACSYSYVKRAMIAKPFGLPRLLWRYSRQIYLGLNNACWDRHGTWWETDIWMAKPINAKVVGTPLFEIFILSSWLCWSGVSFIFRDIFFRSSYTLPRVTRHRKEKYSFDEHAHSIYSRKCTLYRVRWMSSAAEELPKVFGPNVDGSKATAEVWWSGVGVVYSAVKRLKTRCPRERCTFL